MPESAGKADGCSTPPWRPRPQGRCGNACGWPTIPGDWSSSRSTRWPPTGRWKKTQRRPTRSPLKKPSTRGRNSSKRTRPRWRSPTARSAAATRFTSSPRGRRSPNTFWPAKACGNWPNAGKRRGRRFSTGSSTTPAGSKRCCSTTSARRTWARRSSSPPRARLLYDDQYLYLGVLCQDPDPAHLLALSTAPRRQGLGRQRAGDLFRSPARRQADPPIPAQPSWHGAISTSKTPNRTCPAAPPGP